MPGHVSIIHDMQVRPVLHEVDGICAVFSLLLINIFKPATTKFIKMTMNGKKGISPMIATVLLIAFTVAVGGILSMWLTSMTSTQTTTTGSAAEKQILCARSVLSIDEVYYNYNGSNINNASITYKYTYGTETLTGLNFFFIDSQRNAYNRSYGSTLIVNPGDSNTTSMNMTGLTATELQQVRIQAACQSTYPVSTTCKSGQSCMKKI